MSEVLEPTISLSAKLLGDASFLREYGIKYAYYSGSMYKGIASSSMVIAMGKAGLLGFFGSGGLKIDEIKSALKEIKQALSEGEAYGANVLASHGDPSAEESIIELYLKEGVRVIEASAFMQVSPSLVRYRLTGLTRLDNGELRTPNRIIAKVSHPKVAESFMQPAPEAIVAKLLKEGHITSEEAALSSLVSVASDICVEADSGGHTDQGVAQVLLPAMIALRDDLMTKFQYKNKIRVGAAGGIGSPQAAASAFILGADFIVTGSINQCTVEAGTSDAVKDLLQDMSVEDTAYAPAGDMFEMGSKVQVLKKGLFFPARANKLYELYQRYNSLDDIDDRSRQLIQEKYFKRSFESVWQETREYYAKKTPDKISLIEKNPKKKMALVFRWYFIYSTRLAKQGNKENVVDYQVHCGPALGTFNQWVKGSKLERWKARGVAIIADSLMNATAEFIASRLEHFQKIQN